MSHTYKKNYLKQVIFRADFDRIELGDFEAFKKELSDNFDKIEKQKGKIGNFELNIDSGQVVNNFEEVEIWQFIDSKTSNKLELGPTHCLLEYFSYADSKKLLNDINSYCANVLDRHEIKTVTRIGLRYINQIELQDIKKINDWSRYISGDLLKSTDFFKKNGKAPIRILDHIEFKTEEFNTVFKYGIWNDRYPTPITNDAYILDIDCYTRLPIDLTDNNLEDVAKKLNEEAENIFNFSITEQLKKEMDK